MSRSKSASLAAIFGVVFIDLLGFGLVMPLLARYGRHFEANGATLGLLVASFSAMQFLFAPVWGRLSDRVGRRPVLLVGLAGSTASYAVFGFASGLAADATWLGLSPLAWLFVSRIGAGVAGATIPTAQAYIADVTGASERAKGMALIGAAFGIGFTFGPLLGAIFASDDLAAPPSTGPGYLASALSAIAFLFAAAVLREPQRHVEAPTRRPREGALAANGVRAALLGEIFLVTAAFAAFESTLTLLSRQLGYADRDNFFLFAFVGVTLTLAQGVVVRRLAPSLREHRMAPIGLALLGTGLAGLALVERGGWPLLALLATCVVGVSFVNPSLHALLSLTTPAGQQGAVLGLGQSASALARIAGPLAGLALFDVSSAATYGAAAAVVGAGLILMLPVLARTGGAREKVAGDEITREDGGVRMEEERRDAERAVFESQGAGGERGTGI